MGFEEDCLDLMAMADIYRTREITLRTIELARAACEGDTAELQRMADGWASAGKAITEHVAIIQNAVPREMANWDGDAADNFGDYMAQLVGVLETHKSKAGEISEQLHLIKQAIEDTRHEVHQQLGSTTDALRDMLLGGGGLSIPDILMNLASAGLKTLYDRLDTAKEIRADKEHAIRQAFADLRDAIDKEAVQKISGPPKPTVATAKSFSSADFYSRHQPPEIGDVKVSTDPEKPEFPWWWWTEGKPPTW